MVHIENIPHILQYGITHCTSHNLNTDFKSIGDGSLIATRNDFILNNGRRLGDYIPFYFGVRTPMLYVVQNGFNMVGSTHAENVVYCVTSVQKIIESQLEFVFTDGHAVDRFSSQYNSSQYNSSNIKDLESIIDWNAVNAKYWRSDTDLDLKRRKEAEFLVLGDIGVNFILGFVVFNQDAKDKMIAFGANAESVIVKNEYYF